MATPTITRKSTFGGASSTSEYVQMSANASAIHVCLFSHYFLSTSGTASMTLPSGWSIAHRYSSYSSYRIGGGIAYKYGISANDNLRFQVSKSARWTTQYFWVENGGTAPSSSNVDYQPSNTTSKGPFVNKTATGSVLVLVGIQDSGPTGLVLTCAGTSPPQNENLYYYYTQNIAMWDTTTATGFDHDATWNSSEQAFSGGCLFEYGTAGPSFNRDGVDGGDIAEVDGVEGGDIAEVDGVVAVSSVAFGSITRETEAGILVSNDPQYMRKAA